MSSRIPRLVSHLKQLVLFVCVVTLVSLSARLTESYRIQWDWSAGARNSLSRPSQGLLERLDGIITITAYASDKEILRARIRETLDRYRRYKSDVVVRFVDPESVPDEVCRLGVSSDGELRIEYDGRAEHITEHTEQAITNALNRVARAEERWIAFVTGHGERSLLGVANHDLGGFGESLQQRGFRVQPITLTDVHEVPRNTAVLIVAGPRVALLEEETKKLEAYIERGGNLLWLADPGPAHGLGALADRLRLRFGPGQIYDPSTPQYGVDQPTFPVVSRYPAHAVTANFDLITLYPESVAITPQPGGQWLFDDIVRTSEQAWSETTSPITDAVFDEATDHPGPHTLGVAIQPADSPGASSQRIIVIGDGDFLSNAFVGSGGNLELGLNIINWLSHDDRFIALPAKMAPDLSFNLSKTGALLLALGSLFLAPALFLGAGVLIWWKRR